LAAAMQMPEENVPAFMGGAAPRDDPHVAGLAGDAD